MAAVPSGPPPQPRRALPRPPLAFAGERIGLLGGTFNPPHAAHRAISIAAMQRLGLARVWWLVTPGNPLKDNGALPPLGQRLAAARRLAAHPRIIATGVEADIGTAYTAETLAYLRRRCPGVRFVWLMGADNLAGFHRWHQWPRIFALMPVAVLDRPGWRLPGRASKAALRLRRSTEPEAAASRLALRRPPAWTFITIRLSPISSTALRRAGPQTVPTSKILRA